MMKTLAYFASGGYLKFEYNSLPYDRVILIDKAGDGERANSRLDLRRKIINIISVIFTITVRTFF